MKKFVFTLDKVLDYKEQVENNLRSEYSQRMDRVKKQERYIDSLNAEFAGVRNEFEARKKQGCTVNVMVAYDGYLNNLRKNTEKEKEQLAVLKKEAEQKLKEKKQKEYEKTALKKEEQFIDEFVSNTASLVKQGQESMAGRA